MTPETSVYVDSWGVEHDMRDGPCSCGAWHKPEPEPNDLRAQEKAERYGLVDVRLCAPEGWKERVQR